MSWAKQRARFPVFTQYAYLNAGTFGPFASDTLRAMLDLRTWEGEHGRAGSAYMEAAFQRRARVRERIAGELKVPPANVAITDSTTQGVLAAVVGLGLGPDDEVVTTDAEHFGLIGPLLGADVRLHIARVKGRPCAEIFDTVRSLVTPRTRLIALSAVSFIDGARFPWRELREATGLPVLVDGAQAAGAIDLDASEADFFTVSAQKWMCGPEPTGALYVRDVDGLPPRLVFNIGAETFAIGEGTWTPMEGAARFDTSFTATAIAGLDAALSDLPEGRYERARMLTERCRELLLAAGYEVVTEPGQATLVSFRAPRGDTEEVMARLYNRGVIVRELRNSGLLRVSVGWWNDETDLERLVDALPPDS